MLSATSAVSTTSKRSFAGLALAQLGVTLVVCGGLVLLLPAASPGLSAAGAPISVIERDPSAGSARDQRITAADGELSAPDSDERNHGAATGSDVCITVDQFRSISDADVLHVVPANVVAWISHSVEGHSLRGPPADDQSSSDTDDVDGDDDDPIAECPDLLPPATSCETCFVAPAQFLSASSTRSSNLSLRAPPL